MRSYALQGAEHFAFETARLATQARVMLRAEWPALSTHLPSDCSRVLDVGCGNGAYLALLRERLPDTVCVGIDRDARHVEHARAACPDARVEVLDAGRADALSRFIDEVAPSVIIVRFVLQHTPEPERDALLDALARSRQPGRRAILIDTDDARAHHEPACAAIATLATRRAAKQASMGGDRFVGARLGAMLRAHGFARVLESGYALDRSSASWQELTDLLAPVLHAAVCPPHTEPTDDGDRALVADMRAWFANGESAGHRIAWHTVIASGE